MDVAGHHQQRRPRRVCLSKAADDIGGATARRDLDHANLATNTCIGIGHGGRVTFIAREHMPDLVRPSRQRIVENDTRVARDAEEMVDTGTDQCFNEEVATSH
jgi:hypothetical protein